jgi:PAS domain S-box-containing protein
LPRHSEASESKPQTGPGSTPGASDSAIRFEAGEVLAASVGRGIGTWEWDVPGDRIVADERFAQLYGIDPEQVTRGTSVEQFFGAIHPDDLPRVRAQIEADLRTGELFSEEYRLRLADGIDRWVLAEGRCERTADGRPLRFRGFSLDITTRKTAEVRLLELNAELERKVAERTQARSRTWHVSPDLLGALNSEGYFETSNPAWQTVLGWTEEEVASMSIFDLLHPDGVERTRVGFNLTQQGHPAIRFPNRYRHKDGHYRWISWVGVPEDGMVYCSGRDITEEREQAEALSRAEEALRQAQKMEAVGQLTGGIAHDFNNLLQVISANLDLVGQLVGDNEKVHDRIGKALAAVQRGASLSAQLLAFSRKQPTYPRVLNAARLMPELEDLLRRSLGDDVHLEVVVADDLWNTLVDDAQLESSILNLVINARDAMKGPGLVRIELSNVSVAAGDGVGAPGVTDGDYVAIRVSDTGPGMPPDVKARAFEPFFTTKAAGQGTGLGLAMVHSFLQQSGGGARIDSMVGQGTVITLYLPRCLESLHDVPIAASAESVIGGSETVLVAEDDVAVREASVKLLTDLGYRVLEARNGDDALAMIRAGAPIDLLFIDVVMPGTKRSTDVASEGRFLLPHLAVLYTSGYAGRELIKGARLDPHVLILRKPYTAQTLAKKVRQALALARH